jgi:hypothetical protein
MRKSCRLSRITAMAFWHGGPSLDAQPDDHTGPLSLNLRAERSDAGPGRVYTFKVRCTDASGNSSLKSGTVIVPHDQRRTSKAEL